MNRYFSLCNSIQQYLIPQIEDCFGVLSEKESEFVSVAELAVIDKHLKPYSWLGFGGKPCNRKALALSFIAKAEAVAKRQFCNFNGVDRLCQNDAGRDFGADGIITGADRNVVLQLPKPYGILQQHWH
jgi:hypothetical protein